MNEYTLALPYSLHTRPWYIESKNMTTDYLWTQPFLSGSRMQWSIGAAIPIRDLKGIRYGMLLVIFYLENISTFLSQSRYGQENDTRMMIVDTNYLLIGTNVGELYNTTTVPSSRINLLQVDDPEQQAMKIARNIYGSLLFQMLPLTIEYKGECMKINRFLLIVFR